MPTKTNTREALLQAANAVILEWGGDAMTLDAVAKYANVSKGGLLYHFPTKEALVEGMITRLIEEFDRLIDLQIERDAASGAPKAGRWLRAYVRANTSPAEESEAISYALMAAFGTNPKLLAPVKLAFDRWQECSENDGVSPEVATLVRLAADGCWLSGLFGFEAGFESRERLAIVQRRLLAIIDQNLAPVV